MLRRQILFMLLLVFSVAGNVLCQPGSVAFNYGPGDGNPPLGCPCANGRPYADGTTIAFVSDSNGNGPDPTDLLLYTWAMNGEEWGDGEGYFLTDYYIDLDSLQLRLPYYLNINSGGCCWNTIDRQFVPGPQDWDLQGSDWNCVDHPCPFTLGVPVAPANFRASDDSLCVRVRFSWEHDGSNVTGFAIRKAADSSLVTRVSDTVRSVVVQVGSPDMQGYFVWATGLGGQSGASNTDPGSPYAVRFADDSTGDIEGQQCGGCEFTLHFALPGALSDQCSITDSLILLMGSERIYVLATAQNAMEITGHFPNPPESIHNCRVLLVASYLSEGRGFSSTDTTASVFDLFGLSAGNPGAPLPLRTEIASVYPNPFNPETQIHFTVSNPEFVSLCVYNLTGQMVKTLASGSYAAGEHAVVWNGRTDENTPAGTGLYWCRLTTARTVSTKRLLLLK